MAFAPTDLSGVWAGWDGQHVTNSSGITALLNQAGTGSGRDMNIGNPSFKGSVGTPLNSQATVHAGNNVLYQTTDALPLLTTATVWIVGKMGSGEDDLAFFLKSSGDDISIGRNQLLNGGSPIIGGQVGGASPMNYAFKPATEGTWYTIRLRADASNYYIALNNGAEATVARSGASTSDVLSLFFSYGNSNKDFAEAWVYTNNITGTNSDLMEYYLQQKYNHYSWTGSIPTNSNQMADTANSIKGRLVILSISTALDTPVYKSVVCSIDNGITGSRNVTTTETKCGTSKAGGSPSYTVTGSLAANTSPGVSEISADALIDLFDSGDDFLWKLAHIDTPADYYRQGQGFFSSYNETANNGDDVKADFVIEVTSAIDADSAS